MSSKQFDSKRRDFFKMGALTAVSLVFAGKIGSIASAADAPAVVLTEDDPMAKTLGYFKDANKVDVKKWPKRASPEGKKQFCNNCQFFTPEGKAQGKCQIFANKLVANKGWCNTWTAKVKT